MKYKICEFLITFLEKRDRASLVKMSKEKEKAKSEDKAMRIYYKWLKRSRRRSWVLSVLYSFHLS